MKNCYGRCECFSSLSVNLVELEVVETVRGKLR